MNKSCISKTLYLLANMEVISTQFNIFMELYWEYHILFQCPTEHNPIKLSIVRNHLTVATAECYIKCCFCALFLRPQG